jgi:hypothetical protein
MTEPSDDELRARLSRVDPAAAGVPVDPVTSPRAREMVEHAMHTPVQTPRTPSATDDLDDLDARRRRRRPLLLLVAAAAAVLVALVGGAFALTGGAGPGGTSDPQSTLALSLPPADAAMSCMVFDPAFLDPVPVALAGTVTAVEAGRVTLEVDRWYRGGSADLVTIAVPHDTSAVFDGVDFRTGEQYLVAATGGTVNGCGYSGPATPELERAYAEAFGS